MRELLAALLLFAVSDVLAQGGSSGPFVTIKTQTPKRTAEEVEALITDPLVAELRKIAWVREVRSSTSDTNSEVTVAFEPGAPGGCALVFAVSKVVADLRRTLPEGTSVPSVNFNGARCGGND